MQPEGDLDGVDGGQQAGLTARVVCVAAEILSAAAIIVNAWALPWVSYHLRGSSSGHSLNAGSHVGAVLITIGAVGVVLALVQLRSRVMMLAIAELAGGVTALGVSVVGATGRMSHANDLTVITGGTTNFSVGSTVCLFAAVALVATALAVLALDAHNRSPTIAASPNDPSIDHARAG